MPQVNNQQEYVTQLVERLRQFCIDLRLKNTINCSVKFKSRLDSINTVEQFLQVEHDIFNVVFPSDEYNEDGNKNCVHTEHQPLIYSYLHSAINNYDERFDTKTPCGYLDASLRFEQYEAFSARIALMHRAPEISRAGVKSLDNLLRNKNPNAILSEEKELETNATDTYVTSPATSTSPVASVVSFGVDGKEEEKEPETYAIDTEFTPPATPTSSVTSVVSSDIGEKEEKETETNAIGTDGIPPATPTLSATSLDSFDVGEKEEKEPETNGNDTLNAILKQFDNLARAELNRLALTELVTFMPTNKWFTEHDSDVTHWLKQPEKTVRTYQQMKKLRNELSTTVTAAQTQLTTAGDEETSSQKKQAIFNEAINTYKTHAATFVQQHVINEHRRPLLRVVANVLLFLLTGGIGYAAAGLIKRTWTPVMNRPTSRCKAETLASSVEQTSREELEKCRPKLVAT